MYMLRFSVFSDVVHYFIGFYFALAVFVRYLAFRFLVPSVRLPVQSVRATVARRVLVLTPLQGFPLPL